MNNEHKLPFPKDKPRKQNTSINNTHSFLDNTNDPTSSTFTGDDNYDSVYPKATGTTSVPMHAPPLIYYKCPSQAINCVSQLLSHKNTVHRE
mmetsp:Transcript_2869/g.3773  ORF Transcript_2869/g.3773 Transcript_2869/m.3773 type:complete len:92 (+) Transcript_2869:114-389(+)